jgi:hypothetical protein
MSSFEQPVHNQVLPCDGVFPPVADMEVVVQDGELPHSFLATGWLTSAPLVADFGNGAPTHLLARVAEVRKTAPFAPPLLPLQALPNLCATQGTGYMVPSKDGKRHIFTHGPLVATFTVTKCFLDFWSNLLRKRGNSPVFEPKKTNKELTIVVAVVGWEGEHWILANSWGSTDAGESAWGLNGLFKVPLTCKVLSDKWVALGTPVAPSGPTLTLAAYRLPAAGDTRRRSSSVKLKGKTKLTLGHGENKANHPLKSKPPLEQWKEKLSKGDIASVTILGITCAFIIIVVCIVWSQNRRSKAKKST